MSHSKPSSSSAKVPVAGVRVPNLLDYFNAIADSSLAGSEKAVCFAILRYRNQASGECFPSMRTLATTASLGVRGAQKTMQRLASCGVVIYVRRSLGGIRGSRGIPHTLRLDLDALRSMAAHEPANPHANPEPRAGFNPEPDDGQPRTNGRSTTNHATRNREPRAHKPSIEPSKEPTIEPSAVHASTVRWMDASTSPASRPEPARVEPAPIEAARVEPAPIEPARVEPARVAAYQALQAAGVRGPNLLSLARSPAITAELVRAENARLRADPTVTHPPGALVKTLAQHANVTLGRSKTAFVMPSPAASPNRVATRAEPLDAATLARVRQIEQLRAMRRGIGQGSATAVGEMIR